MRLSRFVPYTLGYSQIAGLNRSCMSHTLLWDEFVVIADETQRLTIERDSLCSQLNTTNSLVMLTHGDI